MNPHDVKAAVRAEWASYIQNRVGPAPTPPSEAMERWIRYNQAIARYSANFHGEITVAYHHGPAAFEAVIGALENAFQAAGGPSTRKASFRGLQQ
jgi:hypothetical protein